RLDPQLGPRPLERAEIHRLHLVDPFHRVLAHVLLLDLSGLVFRDPIQIARTFVLLCTLDAMEASTSQPTTARHEAGRGAETRAAILERAVDLASADGLEGLTIGRLASEMGMSKSGLFAHFGSKQELQLATVEAAAAHFSRAVVEPASAAPEGAARLRAIAHRYMDHRESSPSSGVCFW